MAYWYFKETQELNQGTGEMELKKIPCLKYYRVFNVQQCEGIDYPHHHQESNIDSIADAETIVNGYQGRPEIKHGFVKASYNPFDDQVKMPNKVNFINLEEYYSTLFRELTHSTGH